MHAPDNDGCRDVDSSVVPQPKNSKHINNELKTWAAGPPMVVSPRHFGCMTKQVLDKCKAAAEWVGNCVPKGHDLLRYFPIEAAAEWVGNYVPKGHDLLRSSATTKQFCHNFPDVSSAPSQFC